MTPANEENELRKYIREMIQKELDEISTTGGIAGYNVPMAFQGNVRKNIARKKTIAQQLGWKLTRRGKKDMKRSADRLTEARAPYYDFRDEVGAPQRKIAEKISEINRTVDIIERLINMSERYQNEVGINSEELYNRTRNALHKLENRLLLLGQRIREIRGK